MVIYCCKWQKTGIENKQRNGHLTEDVEREDQRGAGERESTRRWKEEEYVEEQTAMTTGDRYQLFIRQLKLFVENKTLVAL